MDKKELYYGMVGGDKNAFIGKVHRIGIDFSGLATLAAGCFSRDDGKNWETGEACHLDPDRIYGDYAEMAQKEGLRDDKIDFVVIVTPNHLHYDVARAFLLAGIHVVCEKPLCFTVKEAEELASLAKAQNLFFAVAHAYTSNAIVKLARQLVQDGTVGDIVDVSGEYLQEWLIDQLGEASATTKLSAWRIEPRYSGISNCVGDIGTHLENTVSYITGLKIKRLAARLDHFGKPLDLNANILVEYETGATGVYSCSQVAIGHMNGLAVRIFGTKGALEWREEAPDELRVTLKGKPPQLYSRGAGYVTGRAAELSHLPAGHPEGYYEAFANFYRVFITALLKKLNGEPLSADDLDFPTVEDGLRGVRFIHAAVESSAKDAQWVSL